MKYKAVRGMEDILPGNAAMWRRIESSAREELEFYGYREIRTPVLEDTSIFVRGIGETTDIVAKEMFTFKDRKDRSLTLRPEGTAPIVRAYIEHSLDKTSPDMKLYYIGPMFRSERPQKGRLRQFHQIGAEIFGASSPFVDAEMLIEVDSMLRRLGLKGFTIKLNSLGCKKDKEKFAAALKGYLEDKKNRLCAICKNRVEKNVLRVLDCKNEACVQAVRGATGIAEALCGSCGEHFEKLKAALKHLKLEFKEAKNLARGLDYYTGTVFEITHPALGGQDAIGAGGRYDNLVRDLGGPDTSAIGYALGIERIIIALKDQLPEPEARLGVSIVTLGDRARIAGMRIVKAMKEKLSARITVATNVREASFKSQMRAADKNNAKIAIILGEDELKKNEALIRNMKTKEQVSANIDNVTKEIEKEIEKH